MALRNRAILMLLARLGLRAHEVAALCLEDLNWHEAHVVIRAGKSHHERVLPLAHDVGTTVAAYLLPGPSRDHRAAWSFYTAARPFGPLPIPPRLVALRPVP